MLRRLAMKLVGLAVVLVSSTIAPRPIAAENAPLICGPNCSDFCVGCGVCQWEACFTGCYDGDGTYWRWYIVCN